MKRLVLLSLFSVSLAGISVSTMGCGGSAPAVAKVNPEVAQKREEMEAEASKKMQEQMKNFKPNRGQGGPPGTAK